MIQKSENIALTENPVLGLGTEIRALKQTIQVMQTKLEYYYEVIFFCNTEILKCYRFEQVKSSPTR